jgi:hypothetical protein
MRAGRGAMAVAGIAMLLLAGCGGGGTPQLMNLRSTTQGPDEFAILPPKPLSMPDDLASLPEPTPGGANRTDPTPEADAIVALGGKPRAAGSAGVPAADGAIMAQVTRFGVASNIRDTLAAEDLEFRRKHNGRILERIMNVSVYFKAYASMALDRYAELERWRAAGVRTVAAPPADSLK